MTDKAAPPFSTEAMDQIRDDLMASDDGDAGATACLEAIATDLARRLIFVERQAYMAVEALRIAESLRADQKQTIGLLTVELSGAKRAHAQLLSEREAACAAEARANGRIADLEKRLAAFEAAVPAKDRIEKKLKAFDA